MRIVCSGFAVLVLVEVIKIESVAGTLVHSVTIE